MRDHGSIGLLLEMGSFGGFFGFCVFWLFLFGFVLRGASKSPTHRILVGNQREKTIFRSWFPFLFLFDARRASHRRTGFWLAIKGGRPLQVVVSLPFLFIW